MQGAGGARTLSNGGTGRPAATLMRALSGWTLLSLSEAQWRLSLSLSLSLTSTAKRGYAKKGLDSTLCFAETY